MTSTSAADADAPIDTEAVAAGLDAIIADADSGGLALAELDTCPFGDIAGLARNAALSIALDPTVLGGPGEAWVDFSRSQPRVRCTIRSPFIDAGATVGIASIEIQARALRGRPHEGADWVYTWERTDESTLSYRNGLVTLACVSNDAVAYAGQRHCMAHFVDESAELSLEFEVGSYDGSATVKHARALLDALIDPVAASLVS